MALVSTLIDDFEWGTLDTNKWSTAIASDATQISVSTLALKVSHGSSAAYNGISSSTTYDLTGSSFFVNLQDVGNQALTSHEAVFGFLVDSNNQIWFTVSGNNLSAYKKVAGVQTQVGASIAYSSSTHAWLRLRESAGTLYWDSSDDNSTWTNRWSLANPFAITAIKPYMQSGCWQVEASGSYATFNNFNLENAQLQIGWKGYTWNKRIQYGDPTYNGLWSSSNVSKDSSGNLILSLTNSGSSPVGAEIYTSQRGFGYGTYTCTIGTRVDNLHRAVVVGGMFTFDFTRPPDYAEIDMGEVRDYDGNANTQVLYSHTWNNGGANTFITDNRDVTSDEVRTYQTVWMPDKITFYCYAGSDTTGRLLSVYVHKTRIPVPGNERIHFNVWVQNANSPSSATAIDIKLLNFNFDRLRVPVLDNPLNPILGINYYHESMGYNTPTDQQIRQDLTSIKTMTNRIKIYHNPYTNNGGITAAVSLGYCQSISRIAKEMGMHVSWVVNVDNSGGYLTDANWSDYVSKVQLDADYAAAAGADEFFVGNEIYSHNNGDAGFSDLPTRIKDLVAATSFDGVVSYQMISSEKNDWIASGIGSLEKISLNVYSDTPSFRSIIQSAYDEFGSALEIGEFSTATSFEVDSDSNQEKWRDLLKDRVDIMREIGIGVAYLFEWRTSSTSTYGFGLLKKNDYYPSINTAYEVFFQGRRKIISGSRLPTSTTPTSSLYFGDSSANVSRSVTAPLQNLTTLTVEARIYLFNTPSYLSRICDDFGSNKGFNLEVDTNRFIQVNLGNGTTSANKTGLLRVPLERWITIAFTWDNETVRMFVNGVFDSASTVALSGGNTSNPTTLYIGNNSVFNRGLPGLIQEFRISDTVRYTATYTPLTTQFTNDSNTVALWRFDDGTGTSAVDSSSNGLTATLGGTPLPKWTLGGLTKIGSTTRITTSTRTAV